MLRRTRGHRLKGLAMFRFAVFESNERPHLRDLSRLRGALALGG
jgi:hypothetical protein